MLRKPIFAGVGVVAASALLAATALPASAAPTPVGEDANATTATTFEVSAGSLTLTVQDGATLTGEAAGIAANTITGFLGAVSVNDARGNNAGWAVTAASTTFTTGVDAPANGTSTAVRYTRNVTSGTGETNADNLSDNGTAVALTGTAAPVATVAASGTNTASWTPTLDVDLPVGAIAGTYSGTVTTSIT